MNPKKIRRIYLSSILLMISSCSAQSIIYEPLGIMDKPLPTIKIYTKAKKEEKNNIKYFIIDDKTLAILKSYISKNFIKSKIDREYQYGSYKITYVRGSEKIEYVIEPKQVSYIFFQQQLPLIYSNKELYEELNILLKRLK